MGASDLSTVLEFMYQTTGRHNPQDSNNLQKHRWKDLRSHMSIMFNVTTDYQCFLNRFHHLN